MQTYQSIKGRSRLSSAERREAIIEAAKLIFAEKGFDGTTTRELAKAAGVSEALLYKHFPSKQSLYTAMLGACAKAPVGVEYDRVLRLAPSTSTLVRMVHLLISQVVQDFPERVKAIGRLAVRSLLEDGEFVRVAFRQFNEAWVAKFAECLQAAAETGEMMEVPLRPDLRAWFIHHIAVALMLYLNPKALAVEYHASEETLVEQAVQFALLGAGLKEEAIRRHYKPEA